jgi:hypothetical protein
MKDPHRENKETEALCEARAPRMGAGQPQNGKPGARCRVELSMGNKQVKRILQ